jgi:hypothetical protein
MKSVFQQTSRFIALPYIFAACVWIVAIFSLFNAEWTRMHLGLKPDWYSMSFYFFIPAALWVLSYRLIVACYNSFNFRSGLITSWLAHIAISIVLALALKFFSLFIDFGIKIFQGDMKSTFFDFLWSARFLFIGSCLENIGIYWLVVAACYVIGEPRKELFPSHILVKDESTTIRIAVADIQLIEAFGNYLKIYLAGGMICSRGTIKSILKDLSPILFTRIHRSYVVNRAAVRKVRRGRPYQLEMSDGRTIAVGDRFRNAATNILNVF